MSSLHTAIPTPSFCSFWHGHPYIPIHFLKMFFILLVLLYNYISALLCYASLILTFLNIFLALLCKDGTDKSIVCIRESVDSLCRDDADTPIVRVHRKAFLTREYSRSNPF